MTERDDHQLLAEFARNHSEAAVAALVQRHLGLVYSTALRSVGNTHAAEEVSQAVFIILAQKAGKLSPRTVLSGWLYQTTRLTAANFLRGEIRRQKREQEAYMQSTLNCGGDASSPETIWPQIAPLLDEALGKLGEADRNAIVLRFFENKSLAEVGTALGASEDAAKMRVNRALEKLRKLFGKRGVTLSATLIAGAVSASSVQAAPAGLAATISTVALTKGAAAGGSTLALVKGALKIMAWMKVKTAVVVGVGVLLAAGTATVIVTETRNHSVESDAVWNDDSKALAAAPPMVILRPTKFPESRAGGIFENGKFAIRCQPAKELLVHAFNWSPVKMIVNTQLPTGHFDYLVTLPENQEEALQEKIREQLHIVGRHEMRDMPVYIVRGKPAPELKKLGSSERVEQVVENGHYQGPMSSMWYTLEYYLKTPVFAEINPSSDCQVDLIWGNPKDKAFPIVPDVAALQKALREQLGLELIATNRPVEMLVVEKMK